ncbi:hypothetical protein CNH00010 [Cryptococcus deneoformans JEC21]|uniref:Uncharacterized protein n=1 Tax=Cryptococcus deneoformans (strain JEC21 / ATCC MYA-565) TaxID=214684 RepID=Q5KC73_CRYD1|nr:hypothetical protein CNH00010 [Cryptococcus neoformans var. neoformans JEC21]AAW44888.1 hypothetical protein CNH00010 [Cryptococcus neoformans var. neoformans JEC21]
MHMDVEEKKQSYEKLCKTLRYDATREDNYRTDALTVFSQISLGGRSGPPYADIDLNSEDMGYLKSHDMSMAFMETDASKVINRLMPSKTRSKNAAEEISEVPSSSQPSSTTASIRILDTAIVFSYEHSEAGAEGSEFKSTEEEEERKVYLGQCLMYSDAGYQMFRLRRALAVCGTRSARVWALSGRCGCRTFAVETSRPLNNTGPMVAADFFSQVNLDLFPHNLIIPSPSTGSFAIDHGKCGLLELTVSRVCDSILWRAYISLAVPVAPNLPGIVNVINTSIEIWNIKYVYMVSNIVGNTIKTHLNLCPLVKH